MFLDDGNNPRPSQSHHAVSSRWQTDWQHTLHVIRRHFSHTGVTKGLRWKP